MAIVNLYPPIMMDTIPAFIRTETCKIYFSLSPYNNVTTIKNVQISLINQKTNASAFKVTSYPSGIKITNLKYDSSIKDNYNYYVEISPSNDLVNGQFELNQFYKIQLRFTSIEADDPPSQSKGINTWLSNNMDYFSEWSKVCLIKGIASPHISIANFTKNESVIFPNKLTEIVGKMYYDETEKEEKEYLKSYNIHIYKSSISTNTLVVDSGEIYTDNYNPNEFNYEINYDLKDDTDYILVFTYTTNNLYTNLINFNFKIRSQIDYILNAEISLEADAENGRIKISVDFSNSLVTSNKNLIIKRASSKTDFNQWDSLKTIPSQSSFVWYDNSIESGIWYKYRIQQEGHNGRIVDNDKKIMCVFENMFLTNSLKQLKIQFNPDISNFKYNVIESQQTTLGSKFPFIKRNGNSLFRTFSIGGLITSLIDTAQWYNSYYNDGFYSSNFSEPFSSKEKIYGNSKSLYDKYNDQNNINYYQDFIYEKEFRQQVEDFLYQHDVKLFRSATQGNILIKLMNINLQPVNQLGRRLYSFTATAIEIDQSIAKNYVKYNIINSLYHIINKGKFSTNFEPFQSIFEAIYNRVPATMNRSDIKLLNVSVQPQVQNAIFYVKHKESNEPIRSLIPKNFVIELQDVSDKDIENCYFNGQNIELESYEDAGYFEDFPESATESTIYHILKEERQNKIDDYVDYNKNNKILTVTNEGVLMQTKNEEEEVEQEDKEKTQNYSLLTKEDYDTYLFMNNHWYLLGVEKGDVGFNIPAIITYSYEATKRG